MFRLETKKSANWAKYVGEEYEAKTDYFSATAGLQANTLLTHKLENAFEGNDK